MFDSLTEKIKLACKKLSGASRLTEENTKSSILALREALISADVALEVIDFFVTNLKNEILGLKVDQHLNPEQFFIKLVYNKLTTILGGKQSSLNYNKNGLTTILFSGLQGAGKTTQVAKLAKYLLGIGKNKILLVSTDIYRKAAITQLQVLAQELNLPSFDVKDTDTPLEIAKHALNYAQKEQFEILLVDSAGRQHVNETMMAEITSIHKILNPQEVLFVVDSMTGQDAARTSFAFNKVLPLTGIILTKTDSDTRGGAALSVRHITQKPIKFMGTGEKLDNLEIFYPERIASRILGMGDILSLIEELDKKVDKKKAEQTQKKFLSGNFTLEDLRIHLEETLKLGNIAKLIDKLPGGQNLKGMLGDKMSADSLRKQLTIIYSMTMQERNFPNLVQNQTSRKKRILKGSGQPITELNNLFRQYEQMKKILPKLNNKDVMAKLAKTFASSGMGTFPWEGK